MKFQKKMEKRIPFAIATKSITYLGINLTKDLKDLYNKNYKHYLMVLKKTKRNGKIFYVHSLEEST